MIIDKIKDFLFTETDENCDVEISLLEEQKQEDLKLLRLLNRQTQIAESEYHFGHISWDSYMNRLRDIEKQIDEITKRYK